ncbi:hypothetical protein AHAS_Ahas06G0123000 [Arachis hypogaea]
MVAHSFATTLHIRNSIYISPSKYEPTRTNGKYCFSNIAYFLYDIWVAITIKVASNSIQDLCSLRMTCTAVRDAGDNDIIHRSISIPPPHATPWWWSRDQEARRFFDRCMVIGHPKLLFWEALRELFMRRNQDIGFQMLNSAASRGHEAAKHALSMTLLLRRDDNERGKREIDRTVL